MKKKVLVILHCISSIFIAIALCIIVSVFPKGNIFTVLRQSNYTSSSQFKTLINKNINQIFSLFELQTYFETDDSFDEAKVMVECFTDGSKETYNIADLLKLSKVYGLYIDENFNVVSNNSKLTSEYEKKLVTKRAYVPSYKPTQAIHSNTYEICRDFLNYLSKYYKYKFLYIDNPTNINYAIHYSQGMSVIHKSNNPNRQFDEIFSSPAYVYASDSEGILRTNIKGLVSNVYSLLMDKNPFVYNSIDSKYYFTLTINDFNTYNDSVNLDYENFTKQVLLAKYLLIFFLVSIIAYICSLINIIILISKQYQSKEIHEESLFYNLSVEVIVIIFIILFSFCFFVNEKFIPNIAFLVFNIQNIELTKQIFRTVSFYIPIFILLFILFYKTSIGSKLNLKHSKMFFNKLTQIILDALTSSNPFIFFSMLLLPYMLIILCVIILTNYSYDKVLLIVTFLLIISVILICAYVYLLLNHLHKINDSKIKSETLQSTLITNVSHDINTPLTSLIVYAELINKEINLNPSSYSPVFIDYSKVLIAKATRLKKLIEDLIEASKASSGSITLNYSVMNFSEAIEQIIYECEENFVDKNLNLEVNNPINDDLVYLDGEKLYRIIGNLITNASKYSLEGTRIYIDVFSDKKHVFFSIKNVSSYKLNVDANLFLERFYRGDISRNTSGSGLGLSIARDLTYAMGGDFDLIIDGDLFKIVLKFNKYHPENEG